MYTSFHSCFWCSDCLWEKVFLGQCVSGDLQSRLWPLVSGQSCTQRCSLGVGSNIQTACFLLCLTNQSKSQCCRFCCVSCQHLSSCLSCLGQLRCCPWCWIWNTPLECYNWHMHEALQKHTQLHRYSERLLDYGENNAEPFITNMTAITSHSFYGICWFKKKKKTINDLVA